MTRAPEKPALLALFGALLLTACGKSADPLDAWLLARSADEYRRPGNEEAKVLVTVFAAGLDGRVAPEWSRLGYEVKRQGDEVGLREAGPAQRGWGRYRLRRGTARPLVVQAPHAGSDRNTGQLALQLYRRTEARLVALNSASRNLPGADQANDEGVPFALLGDAVARVGAPWQVIQLHGFGDQTGKRHQLPADALVISNGTRNPDARVRTLVECLRRQGFDARLFPEQAAYPGGTKNVVGAAMAASTAQFIHVELGATLRRSLLSEPARLNSFASCVHP